MHSIKAISTFHSAPSANRLGGCKRLEGDTAGTADPIRSKRDSIPDNIMLASEKGDSLPKVAVAQRLAGHWSADGS